MENDLPVIPTVDSSAIEDPSSARVRRYSGPSPTSPTERYARYYKMDHQKRGLAVIFNHEFFIVDHLENRTGTTIDCDDLIDTLKDFGFAVNDFHNINHRDITNILEEVATLDHSNCDCLVVVVLSHGGPGFVYAHDAPYNPETLLTYFTSDKCPTLAGKPKLFFIQACRGKNKDAGSSLYVRTKADGREIPKFRIPTQADFLIAYSTVPGYVAWRNEGCGSWFIRALCAELRENGTCDDLLTVLTFVSQRVALDCEADTSGDVAMCRWKQIPCITSMLTRLIKFTKPSNARTNRDNSQDVGDNAQTISDNVRTIGDNA